MRHRAAQLMQRRGTIELAHGALTDALRLATEHGLGALLPPLYGLEGELLIELGRALALDPKILLLDEPMGGMNQEEKEDMARYILDVNEEWGTTIVLIEHAMGVVMEISHRVVGVVLF
jgi:ABC-type branched-subunit amino acid transport system ATPase component